MPAKTWKADTLVNTHESGIQTESSVAALHDGGYVVVWTTYESNPALGGDGTSSAVKMQRYDAAGGKLGTETLVNTMSLPGSQFNPVVKVLADGAFVVAWCDMPEAAGEAVRVTWAKFNANGTATGQGNSYPVQHAKPFIPDIAPGADGGFTLLCDNEQADGRRSFVQFNHNADGVYVGNGSLGVFFNSTTFVDDYAIARLSNGTTVVAYDNDTSQRIGATMYSQQGVLTTVVVSHTAFSEHHDPDVAALAGGGFVVTWTDVSGSKGDTWGTAVHARIFDNLGNPIGDEFRVNELVTGNQWESEVVALKDGGFAVVYRGFDNIRCSVFDADGKRVGIEFNVNVDDGLQSLPSVAELADGRLVFSWTDTNVTGPDQSFGGIVSKIVDARDGSISGTSRSETIYGSPDDTADTINGGAGDDIIHGLGGDDVIRGGEGNDRLYGGDGNDWLDGGNGDDRMYGGTGDDTYIVRSASDKVFENENEGHDIVRSMVSYKLASNVHVEELRANSASGTDAIDLTGNAFDQRIVGNAGANRLDGGGGVNILQGLDGNDIYIVRNAADKVIEKADEGYDVVYSTVSYKLASGVHVEELRVHNSAGTDAIDLTGNAFDQKIVGSAGANKLDGGGGVNTMYGFDGDDVYIVRNADDKVVEKANEGYDVVRATVSYKLASGTHVEELRANSSADTGALDLTGNAFDQKIVGSAGANKLDGGGGVNAMYGLDGDDVYIVRNADDKVVEKANEGYDIVRATVSYKLAGGVHVEELRFNSASATDALDLTGNAFDQKIVGNAGNNRLDGGGGQNTLTGGAGQDVFVFSTVIGPASVDRITDFNAADDTIELSSKIFSGLAKGQLAASAFKDIATGIVDADDRILYDSLSGVLYFDRDGSGGTHQPVQFALLSNKAAIAAADFFVV